MPEEYPQGMEYGLFSVGRRLYGIYKKNIAGTQFDR